MDYPFFHRKIIGTLRVQRAITILLWLPLLCKAEQQDNLRLQLELQRRTVLAITWTNELDHPILLSMGVILTGQTNNTLQMAAHLKIHFQAGSTKESELVYVNDGGVFAGRIDPWVIVMPKGGSYTLRIPLDKLWSKDKKVSVLTLMQQRWTITATYVGKEVTDTAPGGKVIPYSTTQNGPATIPFWKGTLSANVTYSPEM